MSSRYSRGYKAIILLGFVSLMGDIVYEGARGLIPSFLKYLGASASITGLAAGLGDSIGLGLRLISGLIADVTGRYWSLTFVGYGLIASIPLLSIAWSWPIAVILTITERVGKALRTPSRDTIISMVSKDVGAGKAFGMHEFLDQVGAILGPLIVSIVMFYTRGVYEYAFIVLAIPYTALIATLTYAYKNIGPIESTRKIKYGSFKPSSLNIKFWLYSSAILVNTLGLIPASLILYKASSIFLDEWIIPLIYLVIQAVDAPSAIVSGVLYDKIGLRILYLPLITSTIPSILVFIGAAHPIILASVIYGVIYGMQESVYRAVIATITSTEYRGTGYGIFNTLYGAGFLISGLVYGFMLDYSIPLLIVIAYTVSLQTVASILLSYSISIRS
ncbi:MFS transporter [Candidatus Bathyarchaeota archaeon]|nr:MFS transporter [Candidatus Bathyarchaeota archaeon]